jgi:tRNA-uridine 2-sulfurtransferase
MGTHGAQLHAGLDPRRDQSYFLYTTTQEQLNYLHFPLGAMPSKDDVRALAQRYGLSVAQKPDSQDICFVPDGDYAAVIRKMRPQATTAGHIVDKNGTILGEHNGIINYTVGQRRGLRIAPTTANSAPWFVVGLDAEKNHVIVGREDDLCVTTIQIADVNLLLHPSEYTPQMPVMVRVRSTRPAVPATLLLQNNNTTAQISFVAPEKSVARGQAAVLYSADNEKSRVLGGGRIV